MALARLLAFTFAISSCAAIPFNSTGNVTTAETVWVTDVVSSASIPTAVAIIESSGSVTSLLLSPAYQNPPAPVPSGAVASSTPVVITDVFTNTVTATITAPPSTVTVSAPTQTLTEVVTISPLPPPPVVQTAWTAPAQMVDLAAFNITNFASGQQNLHIVNVMPVDTTAVTLAVMADAAAGNTTSPSTVPSWVNASSVMQLFYPADSINPASEPQGGADFYATPLSLHDAQNVSLEYSVFFPVDFDWVQGGKLPGIYGGHTGCSGGDAAVTCFSTRLMWRAGGAGELYLYAPKDKQTDALCQTPPLSVCDAAYGLSIGRGSFNFTAGGWTHVRQTVSLNTPGVQDGGFVLEVNGQLVIDRSDVFYRDAPQPPDDSGDDDSDGSDDAYDQPDEIVNTAPTGSSSDSGDSLGDLLGNLLVRVAFWPGNGVLVLRDDSEDSVSEPALLPSPTAFDELPVTDAVASAILAGFMGTTARPNVTLVQEMYITTSTSTANASPVTQVITPTTMTTTVVYPSANPTDISFVIDDAESGDPSQPVRFTGLFFSTFFGGHEQEYATPKDQYAWFKDFSMTINN